MQSNQTALTTMSFRLQFISLLLLLLILIGGDILYLAIYTEINWLIGAAIFVLAASVLFLLGYIVEKNVFQTFRQIKDITANITQIKNIEIDEIPAEAQPILENLNKISDEISEAAKFIENIGNRKFDASMQTLSQEEGLGKALAQMRLQLQQISEEEQSRNWTVNGIAKFSDLLREKQNLDIAEIAYAFISNLVHYLEANQGAVYIINRDLNPPMAEAVAAYAYSKRKFLKRSFYLNEGLVGRCILDNEVIYMDDIPQNYIHITSGLGDALPRSVLLAPVRVNDITYGVVEVASFNKMQNYQLKFVEDVCEDFASTVANAQINQKTKELLNRSEAVQQELKAKEQELEKLKQQLEQMNFRLRSKDTEIASLKNALSNG
ncbi:MAG: GAF domain-containing protein [Raineya sp.]